MFWSVYALDRMLAMALGRPLGIEDSDCDAEYPFEVDDEDLQQFFSGSLMLQNNQPSLMVGFIALCDLYRIGGRVCRQIWGRSSAGRLKSRDSACPFTAGVLVFLWRKALTREVSFNFTVPRGSCS